MADAEAAAESESQARRRQAEAQAAEAGVAALLTPAVAAPADDYTRPPVPPYRLAPGEGRYSSDILEVPLSQVQKAILQVVEVEAPLHMSDLVARVAAMWGSRTGSRIRARVLDGCAAAGRESLLIQRGDFVYRPDGAVTVRSRANTRIPAEHVAPDEYRAAVQLILNTGHGFTRPELANEVRALLGFGRATEPLQQAVEAQISQLLSEGHVGEGSAGLTLRQ